MKYVLNLGIILIFIIAGFGTKCSAVNYNIDSNGNIIAEKSVKTVSKDTINTGKTFTNSKGQTMPIYKTAKGSFYVGRISKEGKYYRQYLPKDVQEKLRK